MGSKKDIDLSTSGLELDCHECGASLPLLHPHIMLERTDDDDNLICEQCYQKRYESLT
jgi:hypothetical protein